MKPMRFLLNSWGSAGDIYPFFALAQGLVTRGHHVTLALDPMWEHKARHIGARFVPLLRESQQPILRSLPQLITSASLGMKALELLVRHGIAPAYREAFLTLHREAPHHDAIVAHHFAFAAMAAAETQSIPIFTVTLAPGITPGENIAPAGFPFRWPTARFFSPIAQLIWNVGRHSMRHVIDARLNPIRLSLGLSKAKDLFFLGFTRDRLLQLYSPHFAPPAPDWPKEWTPLGFPFWEEPPTDPAFTPALASFLQAGDAPWLFTLGTTVVEHPRDFFTTAEKSLAGRRAIFLAGRHATTLQTQFRRTPHIYITDYLPLHSLLPFCRAAIHQCGIGTLAQVLRAGIPSIAVPFAFDQPQNAIRVVDHGLAIKIPASKISVPLLSSAFHTLETNPSYWHRAKSFATLIQAENGVAAAITRLESYFM